MIKSTFIFPPLSICTIYVLCIMTLFTPEITPDMTYIPYTTIPRPSLLINCKTVILHAKQTHSMLKFFRINLHQQSHII